MKKVYKIMFFVSVLLVLAAVSVTAVWGLRLGVDFRGGSLIEISFKESRPSPAQIGAVVNQIAGIKNLNVSPAGDKGMILRLDEISEIFHQKILSDISRKFGEINETRFDSIGPTIGAELRARSIRAVIILLIAISIYIAVVFRKLSRVLSPWAMGLAAIIALIHDVLIPVGIFAWLGRSLGVEISSVFVAAILTILGYSISDTVVVFDRVRENVLRFGSRENFAALVHNSVMQTLSRSLNTTFTTLLSLIAIYFFGGETIKFFALALMVGIFLGAYSSIFVAAPVLVWFSGRRRNN